MLSKIFDKFAFAMEIFVRVIKFLFRLETKDYIKSYLYFHMDDDNS